MSPPKNLRILLTMSNAKWTTADIPSQIGRRAIVTGANSGIGFYTSLELARHGAHIILASRDLTKANDARVRILTEIPQAKVESDLLDLASLASVRAFAERHHDQPLDLLINSAGVMAPTAREVTTDGLEVQFGTNVVGHFALTALLLPCMTTAAPRVVTIASIAHKRGKLNFDDLQSTRSYSPMGAYQQSKLADLIFARELDRRLRATGSPIRSLAAHPGVANTNLFHKGDFNAIERYARKVAGKLMDLALNSQADGAIPSLYVATAPEAEGGGYYGPQGLAEARGGDVGPAKVAPQAQDLAAAARLWTTCEQLSGLSLLPTA